MHLKQRMKVWLQVFRTQKLAAKNSSSMRLLTMAAIMHWIWCWWRRREEITTIIRHKFQGVIITTIIKQQLTLSRLSRPVWQGGSRRWAICGSMREAEQISPWKHPCRPSNNRFLRCQEGRNSHYRSRRVRKGVQVPILVILANAWNRLKALCTIRTTTQRRATSRPGNPADLRVRNRPPLVTTQ